MKLHIKMVKLLFLTCFIQLLPLRIFGKEAKSIEKFVMIEVIVKDSALLKDASIEFEMCRDAINSMFITNYDLNVFKVTKLKSLFKLPLSTDINYGRIIYNSSGFKVGKEVFNALNNLFIFQNGDNIKIVFGIKSVLFKGKGSPKYNCLFELANQSLDAASKLGKIEEGNSSLFERILIRQIKIDDSLYFDKLKILKKYKNRINTSIYSLISADIWGEHNLHLTDRFLMMTNASGDRNGWDEVIYRFLSSYLKEFDHNKFDDDILVKSYKYCDFLYKRDRFSTMFLLSSKPGFYNFRYSFKELMNFIRKGNEGLVYDKVLLIAYSFEINLRQDARDFLIDESVGFPRENVFRRAIMELKKNSTGPAFPFELPDKEGKLHKLSDYKGKLIILDFWYTGCVACANLAKELKPIIQTYKDNPNVVFMTVSIDVKKESWVKSLEKQIYTSDDEINLYTAGLGADHPIIKHYNIDGFPILIIIKDGKTISTAPPRPRSSIADSAILFKNFLNGFL
ncbi:TlpA disulfide reductase family protein [Pedobacter gandavensis]|uniref:TlpA family protein disulfide reductase n=1 Tax=Pedobacter gandavensis TaxID=2679963 RepID=UPI00292EBE3E|nr:TlpA disulfide reductase family protein [Pedobacter gandavensis]